VCVSQLARLCGAVPPAAEGVRRPERCQIRSRSVSCRVQDESATTGERGTDARSAVVEIWKSGSVPLQKQTSSIMILWLQFEHPLPPTQHYFHYHNHEIFGIGYFKTYFCVFVSSWSCFLLLLVPSDFIEISNARVCIYAIKWLFKIFWYLYSSFTLFVSFKFCQMSGFFWEGWGGGMGSCWECGGGSSVLI